MESTSTPAANAPAVSKAVAEPILTLDLVELELALDSFSGESPDFEKTVRLAARNLGGDFLFALPASGLAEDCSRIAALRIPDPGDQKALKIVFALLGESDGTIRVEEPAAATAGLKRFAEAFVGVLERI
ncbi:hypothetical protein LXM94_09065 [Rhizobium sp. TRM95111]|uniref:hypothetical protein n=1 Tax=Rhizobium alarense TaxID=2846851 RepID=UPI001F337B8C|nr:hypothetical protein [Rhizobium alarense]MCF3640117.1 hypothetical protein [Rhizobium alarense]